MTGRQLGWIFGVLAVLLAGWMLLRTAGGNGTAEGGLDLAAMVGPDVGHFRIDRAGEDPIELDRRSRGWTVNGYPAEDSLVMAVLAGLDTLPPGRLIARSPSNHARLGLTADSATRVRIGPTSAPTAEFLVGGAGTDGRFVRLPEAEESYVFPAEIMDPLAGSEADWRDYTIARVDTAALRRIRIRRGGEIVAEVVREDPPANGAPGPWMIGDAPADTATMRLYLETLTELEASGFPADSFAVAADFEQPEAVVDLFVDAGPAAAAAAPTPAGLPAVSLLFSTALDHPDILVRRADAATVYAIDRLHANLLTTTREKLLLGEVSGAGSGEAVP